MKATNESVRPTPSSILALLFALLCAPAHAAEDTMHYQGYLSGGAGVAVDQQVKVEFALYAAPAGGRALWSETHVITPSAGLFEVQLGTEKPLSGDLFQIDLYLGIAVDGDAEMSPRNELGAAPYAFRAAEADLLMGATADDLDQSAHIDNAANPHAVTPAQIGAATGGTLSLHAADGDAHHANLWTADGADRLYTPRNYVGINTASPQATLHVQDFDSTHPAVLIEDAGSSEGDIAWLAGQNLNLGTFDTTATAFTQHLSISSAGVVDIENALVFDDAVRDKISLFGNRLGLANMYGFGVSANTLYARSPSRHSWFVNSTSAGAPVMHLSRTGLGIGTTSINHELIVQGDDPALQIRDDVTDNSVNAARLELLERAGGSFDGGAFLYWDGAANKLFVGTKNDGANQNVLVVNRSGLNVGIGTSSPSNSYRLSVNGAIRAKEIVVETGWSDFVFDEGYPLRPLAEVRAYIDEHGHLPDVPSAAEVEADGVSLGEMQARLLQKVEELTLYMLDMQRRIDAISGENQALRRRLAEIEG